MPVMRGGGRTPVDERGTPRLRPSPRDALSFGVVTLLGAVIAVATGPDDRPAEVVVGCSVLVLVAALCAGVVRADGPRWWDPCGPWLFFVAFAVLRDMSGGSTSRAAVLVVLPIVWLALFGRGWHLAVAAVLVFAAYVLPSVLVGPPTYSYSDWQRGLAWSLFTVTVAPIVLRVVASLTDNGARLEQAVGRLDAVMQGATLAAVIPTDPEGRIVDFNPGAERLLGWSRADVVDRGIHITALHVADELAEVAAELGVEAGFEVLAELGRTAAASRIWRYVRADGEEIFVRGVVTELTGSEGNATGFLVMAIDATTAIRAQHDLVVAHERSTRLFEDSPQPIALVATDSGELLRINDAFAALFEQPRHALVSQRLGELSEINGDVLAGHLTALRASGSGRAEAEWTIARDGTVRHLVLSSTVLDNADDDGAQQGLVTLTDVSARHQFEQQLAHLADHDPLTGLGNRRLFNRELTRHVEFCRRYGPRGALLVLDLDQFKEVNDSLGHAAGDELIISVAGLLERTVRATDTVARLGGDEFAILLLETDRLGAERVAGAIVEAVRAHVSTLDGFRRNVTVSIGVVVVSEDDKSAADLLADADMTMYDAKDAGRNQYAVLDYEHHQQPRMAARMAWGTRIREAIENDHFVLHLQPVEDVAAGRVAGAEALLRLADTDELVYPDQFLYIAERSDLVVLLDRWVMRHSIRLLAELQRLQPDFRLEVNVSGRSMGHPDLEATLTTELLRHQVDPTGLVLEITETAAVANVELARAFAERVTALGCRFALDDFGAGFGSFYYLKHLLFDYVKIDGEFIAHLDKSPTDQTIVRSIVQMSRGLGKLTVAEYVASAEIHDVIAREGVDFAQGYHVGRPVPVDAFVASYLDGRRPLDDAAPA